MTAKILDGKAVSVILLKTLQEKLSHRKSHPPGLAVVLLGNDQASHIYVQNKRRACEQIGIRSFAFDLPSDTTQEALLQLINKLNHDPEVNGILIQVPLPSHIDTDFILEHVSPHKDVDGFHPYNMGRLVQQQPLLRPCTPFGVMTLLEHYAIPLKGLNAVVVGASNIVGRPMALELLMAQCTVTVCHRATRDVASYVKNADLLVVAIGHAGIVKTDWIKPGAIVIDVGMNRNADDKVVGDIEFESAKEVAGWITPVPGGVGPMTVAALMQNTVLAASY